MITSAAILAKPTSCGAWSVKPTNDVWCERIGLGGEARANGRWSGFAPIDALILNTIWEIKTRTNAALAKHSDLERPFVIRCTRVAHLGER